MYVGQIDVRAQPEPSTSGSAGMVCPVQLITTTSVALMIPAWTHFEDTGKGNRGGGLSRNPLHFRQHMHGAVSFLVGDAFKQAMIFFGVSFSKWGKHAPVFRLPAFQYGFWGW